MDRGTMTAALKKLGRQLLNGAAIGLALVFGYVVVLFSAVAGLSIVSPPLAEEQTVILFLAAVCAVLIVAPPVLVPLVRDLVRRLPEDSLANGDADGTVASMTRNLRIRSRLFKVGAAAAFLLVVMATLLGFAVAQGPGTVTEAPSTQTTGSSIGGTEVTALVLLLFLLRTLAAIYRHNMRLAAFYDSRADYLQAGGKTKELSDTDLIELFSTATVDLGWTERLQRAWERREDKSPK